MIRLIRVTLMAIAYCVGLAYLATGVVMVIEKFIYNN